MASSSNRVAISSSTVIPGVAPCSRSTSRSTRFPAPKNRPCQWENPIKKIVIHKARDCLVEDEAPVRAFASRALRMRGYTVLEAENAEDALKTLEDPGLEVDIFVTDVVMPGMDGPSWVKRALETIRTSRWSSFRAMPRMCCRPMARIRTRSSCPNPSR